MPNPNCTDCGNKLSKPRLAARKRKCYRCEVAARRKGKAKAHDRQIESEDFTAEDYWQLYESQGGKCAVFSCRANGRTKHLTVEHDHSCENGHHPARWCRACVRGLTCGMHNEWIGRAGDEPEVFDSLAAYLRDPPARKTLMENMIIGDKLETANTLLVRYGIPRNRGIKMADMSRSVGPSPAHVPNLSRTVVIRYTRIPRSEQELYQIIEFPLWIDSDAALADLTATYGFSEARAKTLLNNVWKTGKRRIPTPHGPITVRAHGRGPERSYMFSIEMPGS